jgi:hypothetical protein
MEPGVLAPHQQRVIDEHAQLSEKITKLSQFFNLETYATLPGVETSRLRRQYRIMLLYQEVLQERIAAFN